ncbi:hypothetical protein ACFLZ9_01985 [Patescibacteria group bacterium]
MNESCPVMSIDSRQWLNGRTHTGRLEPSDSQMGLNAQVSVDAGAESKVTGLSPVNYMYQEGSHGYYQEQGPPGSSWQGGSVDVKLQMGTLPVDAP